jgi:RNA polymerase-binding transcription factor
VPHGTKPGSRHLIATAIQPRTRRGGIGVRALTWTVADRRGGEDLPWLLRDRGHDTYSRTTRGVRFVTSGDPDKIRILVAHPSPEELFPLWWTPFYTGDPALLTCGKEGGVTLADRLPSGSPVERTELIADPAIPNRPVQSSPPRESIDVPTSRPGGLQLVPLPPHSRSRGGLTAGSSDQPGRRNPQKASSTRQREQQQTTSRSTAVSTPGPLPPEFIRAASRLLVRQRDFRIDQLSQLEATPAEAESGAERDEVLRRLRRAARSALANIDEALRRIERGDYGRCQACGAPLSHARLAAVPMVSMCSGCQHALETGAHDGRRQHAHES